MKKLDLLIIRSFTGPFIVTFFISTFVLIMQFFWLYMDELVGKGLGVGMILQLLLYMVPSIIPLSLPLAILLASIMTFGSMGEYFELVAIKSTGIGLPRFMRPLFVVMIGISGLAFFINNNVIPVANLKSFSLLYDLRNSKPTFDIRPGVFNRAIEGYAIRVGAKEKDGKTISDVVIYDQTGGSGGEQVVLAQKGTMMPLAGMPYLLFRLENGWRYQEGMGGPAWMPNRHKESVRMHFRKWDKMFDLSGMQLKRTDENLFKNAYQMLNISQLGNDIDSLKKSSKTIAARAEASMLVYYAGLDSGAAKKELQAAAPAAPPSESFLSQVPDSLRDQVVARAISVMRNLHFQTGIAAQDVMLTNMNLRKYQIAWHQKLALSLACLLMYLIGAPLGAIIRKGGLGMPMLWAIILFLVYYFFSKSGELLADAGAIPPWLGVWLSMGFLLPIAAWMIWRARNDRQVRAPEWLKSGVAQVGRFFAKRKKTSLHA